MVRIVLANLSFPETPDESSERAIADAASGDAEIVCFPECFVPGYRATGNDVASPDPIFLEWAWARIAEAAGEVNIAVILGTERAVNDALLATALVIN
jgi:predicted amidohydrolase